MCDLAHVRTMGTQLFVGFCPGHDAFSGSREPEKSLELALVSRSRTAHC